MTRERDELTAWVPELLYTGGRFRRGSALVCDGAGRIIHVTPDYEKIAARVVRLESRALLPGLVNAHSHAFQRVIRGRTERRAATHDSFWTWREMMYAAAERLTPEDVYDASRMAFLEMALSGVTAVGEFHYLHHDALGRPYDDPNLLAKEVIRAAQDTGLRIALLRVAYARSGFQTPQNARQARFIERDADTFLKHADRLRSDLARGEAGAWVGVAPHSVRAVPLEYLREVSRYASRLNLLVHMHVAEQPAEVAACRAEHGRTPVELLASEDLLGERFTAVHAVHITEDEALALARWRAGVCACPTTERNLGDGVVPADLLMRAGVPLSLGTDTHAQIDLLEDARELEHHLRLQKLERAVLAPAADEASNEFAGGADQTPGGGGLSALAARLFACATANGARSIGSPAGVLAPGRPADFFTVDLNDPSVAGAGADDLLPAVVFSLARTAVRDVTVGGRAIVVGGRHHAQGEIIARFTALQRRLWA